MGVSIRSGRRCGTALRLLVLAAVVSACSDEEEGPLGPGGHDQSPEGVATIFATDQLTFDPPTVVVRVGDRVLWFNDSEIAHTVTPLEDEWDAVVLEPEEAFVLEFDDTGVYEYECSFHSAQGMKGLVRVIS